MIDHLSVPVRDLARAKAFYTQALAPLGYGVQMEFEETCGIGPVGKPALWLKPGASPQPTHVAFVASDRPAVDAFYAAAIAAGATDNGAPGLRPHYHPEYYGAFVFDPDGHPIEAVCHQAPGAVKKAAKSAGKVKPRAKTASMRAAAQGKAKPKKAKARASAKRPAKRGRR